MIVRQASTVADLWMSKTKSGFLIRFTQNRSGRLDVDMGMGEGRGGERRRWKCMCMCSRKRERESNLNHSYKVL